MPAPAQIREQVTQKIITALEAGTVPWVRPWRPSANCGNPTNVVSRRTYRGVNIWILDLHRIRYGFTSKWFGTFYQIKGLGGMVKKRPADVAPGQWGCPIVFYREIKKRAVGSNGDEERDESFRLLRTYTVFSADQCEGLERFQVKDEPDAEQPVPDYQSLEDLIRASGADIRYGGDKAYYHTPLPEGSYPNHTGGDFVRVPHRKQFVALADFYATLVHELCHWTEPRLGFDRSKHSYAFGELVAELGAAFVATELALPQSDDLSNTTSYLGGWLDAMKADPSYIFRASAWASKASDFLLSLVPASDQPAVTEQVA